MENDKWVKTFIAPDSQVNVTAVPHGKGFIKVQAAVMIGGQMHEKLLYDGDAPSRAQKAFDEFMRPQAVNFVDSILSNDSGVFSDEEDGQDAGDKEGETLEENIAKSEEE